MKLYLMRHGKAEKGLESLESTLNDEGVKQVSQIAEKLKEKEIKVDELYHSGLLRADETASIIKETAFNYLEDIERSMDLAPQAEPKRWQDKLNQEEFLTKDLFLVSHIPFLQKFTGLLLKDDQGVEFSNAAVICLERGDGKDWHIVWKWVPE